MKTITILLALFSVLFAISEANADQVGIDTGKRDVNSAVNAYYDEVKQYTTPDRDTYYDIYDRYALFNVLDYENIEEENKRLLLEERKQ